MQFATVERTPRTASRWHPCVRSLVHRGFIAATLLPTLPLVLSTTDVRTPKVMQLSGEARVEVVYLTPRTQEQFRIAGRASIVPCPDYAGAYPHPRGIVFEELKEAGFDWEKERVKVFDQMSGNLKATWCRPTPGTVVEGGEDEMKTWPETLPKLGEATSEEDKRNLAKALSNFALLLIEPFQVDYVELGVQPDRRRLFARDWEDESVVEFKETLIVP